MLSGCYKHHHLGCIDNRGPSTNQRKILQSIDRWLFDYLLSAGGRGRVGSRSPPLRVVHRRYFVRQRLRKFVVVVIVVIVIVVVDVVAIGGWGKILLLVIGVIVMMFVGYRGGTFVVIIAGVGVIIVVAVGVGRS